jgi:DNA-binding transcriptional ArsR family regulator
MTLLYRDRQAAAAAAEKLKIFAQPYRLMILSALLVAERHVGDIASVTGIPQPALSQQLAELRRAGLVKTRRQAKQVLYALADDTARMCVQTLQSILADSQSQTPRATAKQSSAHTTVSAAEVLPTASPSAVARFAQIG